MSTKPTTNMSDKSLNFLANLSGRKVTLANTLWAIREADEMTQVKMAKILGVSRQYICDVEHNRRIVSVKMAARFAKKLGYSTAHFVQMALQDELNKAGLSFNIQLEHHKTAA